MIAADRARTLRSRLVATRDAGGLRVLAVALVLGMVICIPHLSASLAPPAGRVFAGAFLFQDDYLQYASFAEQAGRGAVVFENKFDPRPQSGFLLNPEWWLAGIIGRLAGSTAFGFQLVGLFSWVLFVFGVAHLMRAARPPESSSRLAGLLPGLLLVLTGSGLGWLQLIRGRPLHEQVDLAFLSYPANHALNLWTHGLTGLALLTWSIALHLEWRRARAKAWTWLSAACLLGLCRPFDLVVFVTVGLALTARDLRDAGPRALERAAVWLWLLPLAAYLGLAFLVHPSFAVWSGSQNTVPRPSIAAIVLAFGPAALLTALGIADRTREAATSDARWALAAWTILTGGALALARGFALQFTTSLGLALLLAAAVLHRPRVVCMAALLLAPTTVANYLQLVHPPPAWFPPRDYVAAATRLADLCQPGDVAYGPSDPSLFVAALTPCHVLFGHRVLTPEFTRRAGESVVFYDPRTSPEWRARYLDRFGVRYVLLPRRGARWLGADSVFEGVPTPSETFQIWRRRE